MSRVSKVTFQNYKTSVFKALDLLQAGQRLPKTGTIILKPNLILSSPPPVTTSVSIIEALYLYCKKHTNAEIIIGEGCGSGTTDDIYRVNGYVELANKYGIRLIDFNTTKTVRLSRDDTFHLKEFHIPEIVKDAFIISVPVLKDHLFTTTTLSMKNMFGIAPAPYYASGWNKSKLHFPSADLSVVDVCLYKKPGLCLVDGAFGLTGSHLSGKKEKYNILLASFDCVAVDAFGSLLLGHNPKEIEYLKRAHSVLGDMENIEVFE